MMRPWPLLIVVALLLLQLRVGAARAEPMLANGGFEEPFEGVSIRPAPETDITGRLAHGWQDNSGWAMVHVQYAPAEGEPHSGRAAQRIAVRRIASGAVQLIQGPVELQEGELYRAAVFARSEDAVPLRVQLRQPGPPYDTYAGKTFRPGPEWARCEFTFASPVTGPALFMLMPEDVGGVDVDDGALEPAELDTDAPPKEGNLLVTGRMVGAVANGWAPADVELDELLYVPPEPGPPMPRYAHEGEPYVIIRGREDAQVSLYSPPVVVNCGRRHTLSLDLRSDPPGGEVWLTVHDCRHDRSGIHDAVNVTGQWQRYVVSGTLPMVEGQAFAVRICPLFAGELHARNVQLVEGEAPVRFEPAVAVEVAVMPRAPNGLCFDGEATELEVLGAGALPEGALLELSVHDLYGGVRPLPAVELPAGRQFRVPMQLPPPADRPRGMFRIEARVLAAGGTVLSNTGQGLVARVPAPRHPDLLMPDSPFGTHIPLNESYTRLAQALGFKWCRIHDASTITKWPSAEPEPGGFRFFDERARLARSRGLLVLGMLDGAAPWASDVPDEVRGYFRRYYAPTDREAWQRYCRTVAGHYRGLIDHWEVWNEPWVAGFFRKVEDGETVHATPEDYVGLLRLAYRAAKEASPGCTVLGMDTHPVPWTRDCLEAGAAGSFDVFSFHQYTRRMPGMAEGPLASLVGQHRAVLREHDLGDVPVWHTEGGPDEAQGTFYRGLNPLATSDGTFEAAWLARYYLTTISLGVEKFFLYTLHGSPRLGHRTWSRLEPGRYLKPWAVAQANLAHLIQGTRLVRRVRTEDGLVGLLFEGKGRQVAALFAAVSTVAAGELAGMEALDLWGNPTRLEEIGREPVYVTGPDATLAMEALAGEERG
jgi:hypothetical protein